MFPRADTMKRQLIMLRSLFGYFADILVVISFIILLRLTQYKCFHDLKSLEPIFNNQSNALLVAIISHAFKWALLIHPKEVSEGNDQTHQLPAKFFCPV